MKILLVAKPWKGGLARYFFLALQDMFPGQIEWIATRPQSLREHFLYRRDPEAWRQSLIQKIESTACDAAFFIGHNREFERLKPHENYVLYIVDDVRLKAGEAIAFRKIFLSDPGYVPELRAAISPEKYGGVLPFAHLPALHTPAKGSQKHDICFIGNRDIKRDAYLENLFAEELNPYIVGNYFMKSPLFWTHPLSFQRAVKNDQMGAIYAQHKITLNIHARVVREGTNMRTFECAGYGIPHVVEQKPGLENYFKPGKEILLCRDPDDMVKQCRFLLNNPDAAQAMASSARQRVLAEHTYHHRVIAVFAHLLPEATLQKAFLNSRTSA